MNTSAENHEEVASQIFEFSKMIFVSSLFLVGLVYLYMRTEKKTITQKQKSIQSRSSEQAHSKNLKPQPHASQNLDRNAFKLSFKFSPDQDYEGEDSEKQIQKQLINQSRQNQKEYKINPGYSFQVAIQNFLNNIQTKSGQTLIYLDQEEQNYRKQRRAKIEKKNPIIVQQNIEPDKKKTPQNSQESVKPNKEQKKHASRGSKKTTTLGKDEAHPKQKLNQEELTEKIKNTNFKENSTKQQISAKLYQNSKVLPKKQNESLFSMFSQQNKNLQTASSFELSKAVNKTALPQNSKAFEQKSERTKEIQFSSVENNQKSTQNLLTQTQTKITPKKQQAVPASTGPVLPPAQQPSQSQSIPIFQSSSLTKENYLQKLIDYSSKAKQQCELKKTKTNNFGRSISNLKQIYETALDFIGTINLGDSKQLETLACVIYDFLINKTIPTYPKQEGWQRFPPRAKNQTKWKISISTYVIKLNIFRIMGHETLWLIVFGKLLSILDFMWKRTQTIKRSNTAYKELDLVKNGYFNLQKQNDMAPKYFTRLDLITYFLFCMTTFDPQMISQYLCETAGQDKSIHEEIKRYQYKWSYSYFWILVESILQNKTKTYFKPVLYMNILSSIYLQIRKNKINSTEFQQFDHLKKYILKEAIQSTTQRALEQNQEIMVLTEIQEETRDFRFDGEDFFSQLETFNFYFKEKQGEYKKAGEQKGFQQFERRCSVFDYFKLQSKIN